MWGNFQWGSATSLFRWTATWIYSIEVMFALFLWRGGPFVCLAVGRRRPARWHVQKWRLISAKHSGDHCSAWTAAWSSRGRFSPFTGVIFSPETPRTCSVWGGLRLSELWDATSVFSWFFWYTRKISAGPFGFFFFLSWLHSCSRDDSYLMSASIVWGGKKCAGAFYYNNKRRHICLLFSSFSVM